MEFIALLRGITPVGKNKIPKMSYLVEILLAANFEKVKTYIQSGNIILTSDLSDAETATQIHQTILDKIGTDLAIIIKTREKLRIAIKENPFNDAYNSNRVLLVFTNSQINLAKVENIKATKFVGEEFAIGSECFYLYLPQEAPKKKLTNNYLEKQLGIVATSRKLKVIQDLVDR